jgi:hypothetical protein
MKQYLQGIDQALWISNVLAYWTVLMIGRSLRKSLPRFWIYVAFCGVQGAYLFAAGHLSPYAVYFWSFYAGMAIETVLLIVVLYEIFLRAFAPLESLPERTVARLAVIIAGAAALTLAWAMWSPAAHPRFPWYVDFLSTLNRSAGAVTAAALWTVVMYARHLGIPWRSRVAGIARGFLVYLSAQAILTAVSGYTGVTGTMWVSRLAMICYLVAIGMWMHAARQKEIPIVLPAPESLAKLHVVVAGMRMGVTRLRERSRGTVPHVHSVE